MKKALHIALKSLKWLVIGVAGLVALVVLLFYLPPVQDFAIHTALKSINASGDMRIGVKFARISFPLKIKVDSLVMDTPGMHIATDRLRGDIAFWPLLGLNIDVREISLRNATVNLGTPDSALYMRSRLQLAQLKGASISLRNSWISIDSIIGRSGKIDLVMMPDSVAKPKEESAPAEWEIALHHAALQQIDYSMRMMPTIDSLACIIPDAHLTEGYISLKNSKLCVESLEINKADATYIVPTPEAAEAFAKAHPAAPQPADTVASTPWEIHANRLRLNNSRALYATAGAAPTTGFDPAYIEVTGIKLEVDSFYNRGMEIRVPVKQLAARERCGFNPTLSGLFAMDSTAMHATGFVLTTPETRIGLDAMMGLQPKDAPVSLNLDAMIGRGDIAMLAPPSAAQIVKALPPYTPLDLDAEIDGTMSDLHIRRLSAEIKRHIAVNLQGDIADFSSFDQAHGNLQLTGNISAGAFIKPALLDAKMQRQVSIPPLSLQGDVDLNRGVIDGELSAVTHQGDVALTAMWNGRRQAYDVDLDMRTFPIQSILPLSGLADIDATVSATGTGLDFFSPKTEAQAKIDLRSAVYNHQHLTDITLDADMAGGHASVKANSANRAANFSLDANGNLDGDTLRWQFNGDVRRLDLHVLALTDSAADASIRFSGRADYSPAIAATRRRHGRPMAVDADVDIASLYFRMGSETVNADSLILDFITHSGRTDAALRNHALTASFRSPVSLDTLLQHFTWTSQALNRDLARRRLAIDTIQKAMPPFTLDLAASGPDNLLSSYLAGLDMSFNKLSLKASNDTVLNLAASLDGFRKGTMQLDSITADLHQHGSYLLYALQLNNRPGTFDQFAHVDASGYINASRLSIVAHQENIQGETGYSLGAVASLRDSTLFHIQFVPFHPIIGYKDWELNPDNFIDFDLAKRHLDANLYLHNSVSSLHLFTNHDHSDSSADDINLQIKDVKLSDWLAINPFAPPVTGDLSADLKFRWASPDLNGSGTVALTDFNYGRQKVGDFELQLDVATNASGTMRATTALMVNGQKAITASGNLNDSTAVNPFMLDFKMFHFPLSVVNPFLPTGTAKLTGWLNGTMDVVGSMTDPQFNGYLQFDSTTVNVTMLGTPFRFSDTKIPVDSSIASFSDFQILGVNENPLKINGQVNFRSLSDPSLKLNMTARDMQLVGSKKQPRAQAYGKAFIDLDADIKGNLRFLSVDAALNLLPGSNVTYIMADATQALQSRSNQDMVRFVNFADTAAVAQTDTIVTSGMMMDIDARLKVSPNTTVTVELDPSGNSRVQLQANGTLNYTQDFMSDSHCTGRMDLSGGYVRYAVPLIGEKSFTFRQGSYVEFTGDMLDPQLHVNAYDDIRANVSGDGNSRVVNFDVLLKVTGSLNQMEVVFDLECPDDITVANELKAMTPEQRANQAMNLLLYGSYNAAGTQTITSGNVATNALYNFLQSQINSWAAQTIKGVDLSFGINQYDKTVDEANTSTMSYSYRVSKSLFDDRFKIIVGGNYATDANADENFSQNLIADISFEYMLNKSGSMYVRIFRHTGYESILEGEITQTGVGFVYRKKLSRIGDMFRFMRKLRPRPKEPIALPVPEKNMP